MPFRKTFFENFLLRASHRNSLNDPFEMNPSCEWFANLMLEIKHTRFGENKEEICDYIRRHNINSNWKHLGIDIFEENGIISFSETKENILMWSHYSNNHSGIIVEFDSTHPLFFKEFKDKNQKYVGTPQRVLYRKERLKNLNDLYEPYFHKSLEWMYEQEYRVMLKLKDRDKILIENAYDNENFYNDCIKPTSDGELKKFNENFKEFKVSALLPPLKRKPYSMFMYKVSPKTIKNIYLGCKISEQDKEQLFKLLEKDNLKHIKVYQSHINDINYSLNFEKL